MVNAKGKYLGAIWPFKLCLDTFTIWVTTPGSVWNRAVDLILLVDVIDVDLVKLTFSW